MALFAGLFRFNLVGDRGQRFDLPLALPGIEIRERPAPNRVIKLPRDLQFAPVHFKEPEKTASLEQRASNFDCHGGIESDSEEDRFGCVSA